MAKSAAVKKVLLKRPEVERPLRWAFDGIELTNITLHPKPDANYLGSEFKFDMTIEIKVNAERRLAIAFTKVLVQDSVTEAILADLGAVCAYRIENFEEIFHLDGKGLYQMSDTIRTLINSLSISTCRGVLWAELRGTYLHKAVLPIFDPKSFAKKE